MFYILVGLSNDIRPSRAILSSQMLQAEWVFRGRQQSEVL